MLLQNLCHQSVYSPNLFCYLPWPFCSFSFQSLCPVGRYNQFQCDTLSPAQNSEVCYLFKDLYTSHWNQFLLQNYATNNNILVSQIKKWPNFTSIYIFFNLYVFPLKWKILLGKGQQEKKTQVTSAIYTTVHCFLVQRISNVRVIIPNQIGQVGSPVLFQRHCSRGGG